MSLAACPKCWDTPCVCGHGYTHMTLESRVELASVILEIDKDWLYTIVKDLKEEK